MGPDLHLVLHDPDALPGQEVPQPGRPDHSTNQQLQLAFVREVSID